jgi:hypothetical protein
MDKTTEEILGRAYHLIRADDRDTARALIKPVLAAERDNIDAWWLAAHAAATPADIRFAIRQVLRLNPEHRPAYLMLARLNLRHPEVSPDEKIARRAREARSGGRWVWNVVLLIGIVALSLGALALVATVAGLTWFHETVDEVGEAVGVDLSPANPEFGTVSSDDSGVEREFPVTQRKPVTRGEIMVGDLLPNEAHVWMFSAQRGQEVLAMLQFTAAGNASHVLELQDANGQLLAVGLGESSDSGTVTLIHTVSQAGSYRLVILGQPDGPRGAYALGLDIAS